MACGGFGISSRPPVGLSSLVWRLARFVRCQPVDISARRQRHSVSLDLIGSGNRLGRRSPGRVWRLSDLALCGQPAQPPPPAGRSQVLVARWAVELFSERDPQRDLSVDGGRCFCA